MSNEGNPDLSLHIMSGLRDPVEILVDSWGVPHVYASSVEDAFFAQGFVVAQDRLWQIDLWRRRGLGLLSEVFGPSFIEKDRAAKLFLYRGDMHYEWLAYGSDTKRIATAFVAGINGYIGLTEKKAALLPEEFRMMDYRPALWSPEDIACIRSHGLYRNLHSEVERALILRDFGPEVEALRRPLDPPHEISVPEGLDLSLIPDDILRVYELATTPVEFGEVSKMPTRLPEGSNNWAVSPERTATGRPILANDPHRAQSVPSLRYIVHLSAPGMDVIGAGEPALPGISIGHNGHIAFGLTIFSIDQEDLYVYEINPYNSSEYRYRDHWEPMTVEKRKIPVKGGDTIEVELKYTRHGPVIAEDSERHVAFAVRAAWLEPGMAPYLGSIDYMRARNWDEFLEAMNRWGAPGENQVYADTEGNIGWKPAGLIPKRPNWDGLLPVPGDGRYEWEGFLDVDELPMEFNPSRGWVATANEMNLTESSHREYVGFEWHPPFRYQRIAEVLAQDTDHTLQGSVELQADYLSIPARHIVAKLDGLCTADPKVEWALKLLREWDHVLAKDSTSAALFEFWYRLHLSPSLRKWAVSWSVPPERQEEAVAATVPSSEQVGDVRTDLDLLKAFTARFDSVCDKSIDDILLSSLSEAVSHLELQLGSDPGKWTWGSLHQAFLTHPLSPLIDEDAREQFNVGPVPRSGSGDTVGNTSYSQDDFRQIGGFSFRVVLDVGEWDNSLAMNSPGQSGDPRNPNYADLFRMWARDEVFPLLYSRERVVLASERRVLLKPEKLPKARTTS